MNSKCEGCGGEGYEDWMGYTYVNHRHPCQVFAKAYGYKLAQGIEARSGETTKIGSTEGESPVTK